jgi:uncharacterized protein YecT (DUF1311 family)
MALLVWGWALAQSGCDNPSDDFDRLYCVNQEFVQSDKELNDRYKELAARLNPAGQKLLRDFQRQWIRERNKASQATLNGEVVYYMGTATRMTKERVEFLKARLRECNSTGCNNNNLR